MQEWNSENMFKKKKWYSETIINWFTQGSISDATTWLIVTTEDITTWQDVLHGGHKVILLEIHDHPTMDTCVTAQVHAFNCYLVYCFNFIQTRPLMPIPSTSLRYPDYMQ